MSEAEQEQPSGWRRWFRSTGEPPAWNLVRYMACGLFVGAALGAALPMSGERSSLPSPASSSPPPAPPALPESLGVWR